MINKIKLNKQVIVMMLMVGLVLLSACNKSETIRKNIPEKKQVQDTDSNTVDIEETTDTGSLENEEHESQTLENSNDANDNTNLEFPDNIKASIPDSANGWNKVPYDGLALKEDDPNDLAGHILRFLYKSDDSFRPESKYDALVSVLKTKTETYYNMFVSPEPPMEVFTFNGQNVGRQSPISPDNPTMLKYVWPIGNQVLVKVDCLTAQNTNQEECEKLITGLLEIYPSVME
jgi:hypothetical protein